MIKKGLRVIVLTGKDKKKEGEVIEIDRSNNRAKVKEINPEFLIKNGFARKSDLIKVLGRGKLKAKVNVTAHYFSATAEKAVEKAGGKIKKLINE